ncbi:hypothetical protein EDD86DRAFT_246358 [Gorgonomyces haynaldii]|nr:hypothetical protein EDD86DRAFT_246358 [Gorgonomyces haynaldii]
MSNVLQKAQALLKHRKKQPEVVKPVETPRKVETSEDDSEDAELAAYLATLGAKPAKQQTVNSQYLKALKPSTSTDSMVSKMSETSKSATDTKQSTVSEMSEKESLSSDLEAYLGKGPTKRPETLGMIQETSESMSSIKSRIPLPISTNVRKRSLSVERSPLQHRLSLTEGFGRVLSVSDIVGSSESSIDQLDDPFESSVADIVSLEVPSLPTVNPTVVQQHVNPSAVQEPLNPTVGLRDAIQPSVGVQEPLKPSKTLQPDSASHQPNQVTQDVPNQASVSGSFPPQSQIPSLPQIYPGQQGYPMYQGYPMQQGYMMGHPMHAYPYQPMSALPPSWTIPSYLPQPVTQPIPDQQTDKIPEIKKEQPEQVFSSFLDMSLEQQIRATASLVPNLSLMDSFVTSHLELLQDFVRMNEQMKQAVQEVWTEPVTLESTKEYIEKHRPKAPTFEECLEMVKSDL